MHPPTGTGVPAAGQRSGRKEAKVRPSAQGTGLAFGAQDKKKNGTATVPPARKSLPVPVRDTKNSLPPYFAQQGRQAFRTLKNKRQGRRRLESRTHSITLAKRERRAPGRQVYSVVLCQP